jgi:uncharacterized iron-regulated membrane protein
VPIISRWSRSLHRWIAYVLGALVILWVVTGVVMMFPAPPTIRAADSAPLDPSAALRSPSEAVQALPAARRRVRGVTLRNLAGRLVYDFAGQNGAHILVDATTAQRVELTDSLAVTLARRVMVDSTGNYSVRQITQHDQGYRFGPLPVYRIELDDKSRTLLYVAPDGSITSTSNRSRVRATMAALHEFEIPGVRIPAKLRKLLLLGASTFTIVLALTGYILALPARRRA